jgi:hypothetical protein
MYPEGHFLGYTPGRPDPLLPKGLSWRLEPGTDLVIQLHLKSTGRREVIRPEIAFYFTDAAPERAPLILRLGRQTIDIAAEQTDYRVRDSYVLPVDVELHALKPHAHYLARTISVTARLPDGVLMSLLQIDDWDFRWQNVFRFVEPVSLPRGSTISVQLTYDNSSGNPRNPSSQPFRVRWGPDSLDEMGDVWAQVLARDEEATVALANDFRPKAAAEELAGLKSLLDREPENPVLHDDVALLYL